MANVKPSAFGTAITPAATTILTGETAGGTAGRFTVSQLPSGASDSESITYLAPFTGSASRNVEAKLAEFINAADFGAVADGVLVRAAGAMTSASPTLTVTGGAFVAGDVGKVVVVMGAGAAGVPLVTTISARTSATVVTLAANAGSTVTVKDVTYGTNNSTALMNMRAQCAGEGKPHYNISFPAGTIVYDNPRWIYGIKSVALWCNGTTFLTTNTGGSSRLARPLYCGHMDEDQVLTYNGTDHFTTTYLFNDANAGASTITLTTGGTGSVFAAGKRIFLYYYDTQFGGYPKNPRFFEWHEILSVAGDVLTLREPLRYNYRNAVKDFAGTPGTVPACGKPRVLLLDRSDWNWPELVEIHGGRWLPNPLMPGSSQISIQGRNVLCEGMIIDCATIVNENETFIMRNCDCTLQLEADKQVRYAEFTNCRFAQGVDAATGIDHVVFDHCQLHAQIPMSPRHMEIKNCTFSLTAPTPSFGVLRPAPGFGSEVIELYNNTIISDTALSWLIDDGGVQSITVGSVSGTSILLDDTIAGNQTHIAKLREGTLVWKSDMSKFGRVTGLSNNGSSFFVIAGDWAAPVAFETWMYIAPQKIRFRDNVIQGVRNCYPTRSWAPHLFSTQVGGTYTLKISSEDIGGAPVSDREIYCYVKSITSQVTRAHTGGGTANLRIIQTPSGIFYLSHETTQVGYTRASIEGHYESLASGTLGVQIPKDLKWSTVQVYFHNGASGVPAGTRDQQATWSVEMELISLA